MKPNPNQSPSPNQYNNPPEFPPLLIQQTNTPLPPQNSEPPPSYLVREIMETLLFTFFVVFFVRSATQNFLIEGSSMLPTLEEEQYVIVNKLVYYLEEPERGDIVVLHYPNDRSRDFIKRIIGLPGDTVEIRNSEVRVNGALLTEPYISAPPNNNDTWTVPADHFFVVGDNRPSSSDSRAWSYLPREDLIGRAWVVYWPPRDWKQIPHFAHPNVPNQPPPSAASP